MGNVELTKKVPLELLCLLLLQERDMYGYEMVQELSSRSLGIISINITTLYLALKRLSEKDYVSIRYMDSGDIRERSRIYYHFEPTAKDYRDKLLQDYLQAVRGVQSFLDNSLRGEL